MNETREQHRAQLLEHQRNRPNERDFPSKDKFKAAFKDWSKRVKGLCNALADMDGLPRVPHAGGKPATQPRDNDSQYVPPRRALPPGLAYDDSGALIRATAATTRESAELLDGIRGLPISERQALIEKLGLTVGADSNALASERQAGKSEGQREVLQRLFSGVKTGKELVERAATMAFVEIWPEDSCPLTANDLAGLAGMSPRTAARRKSEAEVKAE